MTEDAIELDVPEGAKYGDKEILSVFLNRDLERLFINYESDQFEFEQITVSVERTDDGWKMENSPVGFVPPEESQVSNSPGAMESERMYNMMENYWNIQVF